MCPEVDPARESDKRNSGVIGDASGGHIISGQKGYKLTIEATVTEIAKTGWLKS